MVFYICAGICAMCKQDRFSISHWQGAHLILIFIISRCTSISMLEGQKTLLNMLLIQILKRFTEIIFPFLQLIDRYPLPWCSCNIIYHYKRYKWHWLNIGYLVRFDWTRCNCLNWKAVSAWRNRSVEAKS